LHFCKVLQFYPQDPGESSVTWAKHVNQSIEPKPMLTLDMGSARVAGAAPPGWITLKSLGFLT
jgi:hypothetical protein